MSLESDRGPDQAAREADGWLTRLVGALPDLWFRISADDRFLAWGGPVDDLYTGPETFVGRSIGEVMPPAVAALQLDACARARAGGGTTSVEYALTLQGVDRSFVAIVCSAGDGEVVMFVREVTARVAAERRVADSERRFRAVIDVANEGVWMLDADGLTTFVTERMAGMLGFRVDDILGHSPLEFIAASYHDLVQEQLLRRRDRLTESVRVVFVGADGEDVETTVAATPITDEEGRYLGSIGLVTDERDAARRERELAESRRLLGTIAEVHDDVLYVGELLADGSYVELFTGPGNERLLGGPVTEGVSPGDAWISMIHPDHQGIYAAMNERILRGEAAEAEYILVGYDDVERWVLDRAVPRPVEADGRRLMDGIATDVTARHAAAEQLKEALAELHEAHLETERLARTDALTGVANRRAFSERATRETTRADRSGSQLGVVLLDVDHFKRVNDTFGHDVGDEVLLAVARRLTTAVRGYDTVARWGGEEFIVLVADVPDPAALARVAEGLIGAVRESPIPTSAGPLRLTISAGTSVRPPGGAVEAAIDLADRGLYAAKRRGRDRVFAADELTERDRFIDSTEAMLLAEGLATAASVRGAIPLQHSADVAELASRIATAIGLDADTVYRCRLGGWLHDVGKLAIPDEVLRAAALGDVTPEVRAALDQHPEVGASIIAGMPALAPAAPAVRHHLDWYDGTGRTSGPFGEDLPLEARIVAVADAWVTLTAGRARTAGDPVAALEALHAEAGRSLDPALVQTVARLVGDDTLAA